MLYECSIAEHISSSSHRSWREHQEYVERLVLPAPTVSGGHGPPRTAEQPVAPPPQGPSRGPAPAVAAAAPAFLDDELGQIERSQDESTFSRFEGFRVCNYCRSREPLPSREAEFAHVKSAKHKAATASLWVWDFIIIPESERKIRSPVYTLLKDGNMKGYLKCNLCNTHHAGQGALEMHHFSTKHKNKASYAETGMFFNEAARATGPAAQLGRQPGALPNAYQRTAGMQPGSAVPPARGQPDFAAATPSGAGVPM